MTTLIAITRHELRRALRDRALPWLLVLFAALAAYGAWNGAQWAKERAATVQLITDELGPLVEMRREQLAEAPAGTWPFSSTPQLAPFRLVLRPGAMAALSIGQAEAYPYAARMIPLQDITMFDYFKVDVDNPAVRAAGRFDLAFVIVFVLPLVLLAAAFDLWSRERERGVAAMVLSQPVGPLSLLAGKALARALLVLPPVIAIVLASLIAFGASQPEGLAATAVVVLVYGLFWIALAALINVFARRSTDAALAGGAAWLAIGVLAPALALATANVVSPAPSELQFSANYLEQSRAIRKEQREARGPELPGDPAPKIPDRIRNFFKERTAEDQRLAPLVQSQLQARAERRAVLDALRLFLPSVAVQDALDRIAGADADRAVAFQSQAMSFTAQTKAWLAQRLANDQPLASEDYDHLPRFQFREAPAGAFQTGVLVDLAALAAAIAFLAAGAVLGRRSAASL
ncbi:ABC transporter permease subunit [Caulobacter segnis]|uniref:ABC transporter permease subunit n=1 Tax=Caulobacter segnis TaxID=88688 RepID=UPI0024104769|nr:ABC transporter permease subunit [Caulobacter segnis]MDG2523278.1 ABC transporter permease subunit [Caulobacter segnis]